jgi:hypothetical protein
MDYQKHYSNLISTRKSRNLDFNIYYEKHHIIPKCLGGSNEKENLISLTAREHFVAHWLLYRIYQNKSLAAAFWRMCLGQGNKNMKRHIPSSRAYEEARIAYISNFKNQPKHTEIGKKNIGLKNSKPKPLSYGEKLSKLMKEGLADKISKSNKGVSRNRGRKVPWAVGRRKSIFMQYDTENNIIKEWKGMKELKQKYNITSIYNAFKNNKIYKNSIWKIVSGKNQEN